MMDVYLDERGFAVDQQAAGGLVVSPAESFAHALSDFALWGAANAKRRRMRLWLSGGLCRPFLVPGLAEARNAEEHLRIATAIAPRSTGLAKAGRVWLDKVRTGQMTPAAAVDAETWEALDATLRATGVRATAIGPWWGAGLRFALQRDRALAGLALREGATMTVFFGAGENFSTARTFSLVAGDDAMHAVLLRISMSEGLPESGIARLSLDLFDKMPGVNALLAETAGPDDAFVRWCGWRYGQA